MESGAARPERSRERERELIFPRFFVSIFFILLRPKKQSIERDTVGLQNNNIPSKRDT